VDKGGPNDQRGRLIGRTKGGLNTKLHAVTDAKGRPLKFFMTASQVSDLDPRRLLSNLRQKVLALPPNQRG
jgi:hypothetical protein